MAFGQDRKTDGGDWPLQDEWMTDAGLSEKEIFCDQEFAGVRRLEFDARAGLSLWNLNQFFASGSDRFCRRYFVQLGLRGQLPFQALESTYVCQKVPPMNIPKKSTNKLSSEKVI